MRCISVENVCYNQNHTSLCIGVKLLTDMSMNNTFIGVMSVTRVCNDTYFTTYFIN